MDIEQHRQIYWRYLEIRDDDKPIDLIYSHSKLSPFLANTPLWRAGLGFWVWVNTWKLGNPIQDPIKPWWKKPNRHMPCAMANSSQEDHQVIFSRLYNEYVPCIVDFGGHLSLTNKSRYDFYKFVQQLLVAENSGTHVMETVLLSWTSLLRSAISCDRTQMGWFISSNPTPLKNDGLRTSWDDEIYEIPNIYIYI